MPITYRDLTTLEDFAAVVELEREIWGPGYDEVVPVPILAVTVMRGGILIGAFDGRVMVGFVYSLPGIKHGKPTQWSHMAGVVAAHRGSGVGYQLKLLQRERALGMGLDLIEWTYDPMQAMNAHLNFAKLAAVAEEYEINVYGESSSPLHKGNPTDRFVAEWFVADARVADRLRGAAAFAPVLTVERASATRPSGEWLAPTAVDLALDAKRISVEIPTGFSQMLSAAADLALEWRMTTREIEFFLNRPDRKGTYLLVKT
jgi:predicted GNAT superfamily acetyltransferase